MKVLLVALLAAITYSFAQNPSPESPGMTSPPAGGQSANSALSQKGYDKAVKQFGLQGTVELVSTIGYYAMIGIFLKSFGVPTPDGGTPLK